MTGRLPLVWAIWVKARRAEPENGPVSHSPVIFENSLRELSDPLNGQGYTSLKKHVRMYWLIHCCAFFLICIDIVSCATFFSGGFASCNSL